jgi:hypothetical protein
LRPRLVYFSSAGALIRSKSDADLPLLARLGQPGKKGLDHFAICNVVLWMLCPLRACAQSALHYCVRYLLLCRSPMRKCGGQRCAYHIDQCRPGPRSVAWAALFASALWDSLAQCFMFRPIHEGGNHVCIKHGCYSPLTDRVSQTRFLGTMPLTSRQVLCHIPADGFVSLSMNNQLYLFPSWEGNAFIAFRTSTMSSKCGIEPFRGKVGGQSSPRNNRVVVGRKFTLWTLG